MKSFNPVQQEIEEDFWEHFNKPRMGISTGLASLDELILGFGPFLYILGGVSGIGKSSLMADFILAAAKEVPVGVFSIEMGEDLMMERLIFNKADVNYHKALCGRLTEDEKEKLKETIKELKGLKQIGIDAEATMFYPEWLLKKLDEKPLNSIEYTIESWYAQGCRIFFLDYLQLADYGAKTGREDLRIKQMTRTMKLMSVRLKIPIILLSQLKKEVAEREDPTPKIADLRDSGFLINDADVILFVHRPEFYEKKENSLFENTVEEAKIIVAKHRHGPTGEINVQFKPYCMSYGEL